MSVLEQIKYIDNLAALSGNPSFVSSPQHQYIAAKIDQIAIAIKDYAQANYPTIYNNPNATIDSYRAMAYGGLIGTKSYEAYINGLLGATLQDKTDYFNNSLYSQLIRPEGENKCP